MCIRDRINQIERYFEHFALNLNNFILKFVWVLHKRKNNRLGYKIDHYLVITLKCHKMALFGQRATLQLQCVQR